MWKFLFMEANSHGTIWDENVAYKTPNLLRGGYRGGLQRWLHFRNQTICRLFWRWIPVFFRLCREPHANISYHKKHCKMWSIIPPRFYWWKLQLLTKRVSFFTPSKGHKTVSQLKSLVIQWLDSILFIYLADINSCSPPTLVTQLDQIV